MEGVPHNAPELAEKRVEERGRSSGWDCRGKASDADDFGGVVAVEEHDRYSTSAVHPAHSTEVVRFPGSMHSMKWK